MIENVTNSSGEGYPSDSTPRHEEVVPCEYYNVRVWGVVFLVWAGLSLSFGISKTIAEPLAGWRLIVVTLAVGEWALWLIGLRGWSSTKIFGFWLIFVLAHLLFAGNAVMLAKSIHQRKGLQAPATLTWRDPYFPKTLEGPVSYSIQQRRRQETALLDVVIAYRGGALVLVFWFFLLNLWSRGLLAFFRKLDGKCPLCKRGALPWNGPNRRNQPWQCDSCAHTISWRTG